MTRSSERPTAEQIEQAEEQIVEQSKPGFTDEPGVLNALK